MQGVYILVLLSIIFGAEYIVIRYQLNSLTEAERKIDFARSAQVKNQEIALQLEFYLQGKTDIAAELASLTDEQDNLLNTLGNGGRIDGSKHFLKPLTRLPRITFDQLHKDWNIYKAAIGTILNAELQTAPTPVASDSTRDSTALATVANAAAASQSNAKLTFESRWLTLARWYDKLIADLEYEVENKSQLIFTCVALFIVLNIAGLWVLYYFFRIRILQPLKQLENSTSAQTFESGFAKNEIGVVADRIRNTIEDLRDATDFVVAIGEGKLDLDYKSLDSDYTKDPTNSPTH
jgi:hypothetical protein